jgi:large subunit ribosomal protein L18
MDKKESRLRRGRQTRPRSRTESEPPVGAPHQPAHLRKPDRPDAKVLVSASTVEAEVRAELAGKSGKGGNAAAAALIGKRVAEKALKAGITEVAFDRSGFRYHGRVKALAEAAREAGLKF